MGLGELFAKGHSLFKKGVEIAGHAKKYKDIAVSGYNALKANPATAELLNRGIEKLGNHSVGAKLIGGAMVASRGIDAAAKHGPAVADRLHKIARDHGITPAQVAERVGREETSGHKDEADKARAAERMAKLDS